MKILGPRLKARRRELRLSQAQLAERSKVSQPLISRIEAETVGDSLGGTIDRLAAALETNVDYLCGLSDDVKLVGTRNTDNPRSGTVSHMAHAFAGDDSTVEAALLRGFDKSVHTFADATAAREVLTSIPDAIRPGDLATFARRLLDAAAWLRRQAIEASAPALLAAIQALQTTSKTRTPTET